VVDENGNVLAPFSQGRQVNGDGEKAVIEVFAESTLPHGFSQIHVCGGHYSGLQGDFPRAADPFQCFVFHYAQELHLQLRHEIAYFIQE
jgi:hypothetical protein